MNNQSWILCSSCLWGVSGTDLHKTDDTETKSWKIQACLIQKGLKISLSYVQHFPQNLEAEEYIVGKTINFPTAKKPRKEINPHDPEKNQGTE